MIVIPCFSPKLSILGRHQVTTGQSLAFALPGVTIRFRTNSRNIYAHIQDSSGNNFFNIIIDGELSAIINPAGTKTCIAENLDGQWHRVEIFKRTESNVGLCSFSGILIDDMAEIEPVCPSPLRLEFIGDSITCGYGIEASGANEKFEPRTENAYLSYASVASRVLGADSSLVCYSGKGVYRSWGETQPFGVTMLDIFERSLADDHTSCWDFSSWLPHAAIVCLGSNDSSPPLFLKNELFVPAYQKLINRIMECYGADIHVFCLTGPVLGRHMGNKHNAAVNEAIRGISNKKNTNIHFYALEPQLGKTGYGAQWHPSVQHAKLNGEELATFIASKLDL